MNNTAFVETLVDAMLGLRLRCLTSGVPFSPGDACAVFALLSETADAIEAVLDQVVPNWSWQFSDRVEQMWGAVEADERAQLAERAKLVDQCETLQ